MSIVFKAITKERIDYGIFLNTLRENRDNVYVIENHPTYRYFVYEYSARGAELIKTDYGYEIRTTSCSNAQDYLLANRIALCLKKETNARFYNEENSEVAVGRLFDDIAILKHTYEDVEILKVMLMNNEIITLYGPLREFNISYNFRNKILELEGDKYAIAYKFSKLFLNCQYPSEEFESFANLMKMSNEKEEPVFVQTFSNSQSMILENVDTIIFGMGDDILYLKRKILSENLAPSWELLDEFTIAAKKLSDNLWTEYFNKMRLFNGGIDSIGK